MGNVNMEASQINDRTGSSKMSVAQHLKALDALASKIENLPTFTSNDRAFLEELPAFPSEDGTKVLTAITSGGETSLSYETASGGLPADPENDGARFLKATTESGNTVLSYENMKNSFDITPDTGVTIDYSAKGVYGGIVSLNISATKTLALNTDNLIATLPAELKPANNVFIAGYNSSKGSLITCFIDAATGGVYVYPIAATADSASQTIMMNFVYGI